MITLKNPGQVSATREGVGGFCNDTIERAWSGAFNMEIKFVKVATKGEAMKYDKLDKVVSEYVRLSAADDLGYAKCSLCGSVHHWKEMDCAHYIPRQNMATRFLLMNLTCCCQYCNRFLHGNLKQFELYLCETYGQDSVTALRDLGRSTVKITQAEINELTKEYRYKLSELKRNA